MTDEEQKKMDVEYVAKLIKQQTLFKKQLSIHDTELEGSFMVAYRISRRNKPFSDVDENFRITGELLSPDSMKITTTGQDLYELTSIATDGARALRGENVGMVNLLEDKIRKDNPNQAFLSFHCILHQENLCKSVLNLKHVMDPVVSVVNTTRARALNHRQFKSLLRDMEAEHGDVLFHNNVQWLSLGKLPKRMWNLRKDILLFRDMTRILCEFVTKMDCDEWKYGLIFAADVFEKLNELNELLAHEMYKHVKSFQAKLYLFSRQAIEDKFTHFLLLGKEKVPANVYSKIKNQLRSLTEELERMLEDFRQIKIKFNLLTSPFSADVDASPDELQLEMIGIQSDHSLKEMFHSLPLVVFYKNFVASSFSIFGSTYICEQSFSCKSENRSMVSDTNLNAVMRVSTSDLVLDFKRIVKQNCDQKHFPVKLLVLD
uniref:DUF4371 domain-containing protein n=1 Tax=Octopus bimaculoides TaxID=37653 RepID=A0A0L8HPT4_OCTBM